MKFFVDPEKPSVIVDENGVPVCEVYGGANRAREAQFLRTLLISPQALEVLLEGLLLHIPCAHWSAIPAPFGGCTCPRCTWVRRAKALVEGG